MVCAHHSPGSDRESWVLHLADQLADLIGYANFAWEKTPSVSDEDLAQIDLTREAFDELLEGPTTAKIREEVQALLEL